jgi:hypothetical protein
MQGEPPHDAPPPVVSLCRRPPTSIPLLLHQVNTYGDGTSPLGSNNPADNVGDACDDTDGDTVSDLVDNCPLEANTNQVGVGLQSGLAHRVLPSGWQRSVTNRVALCRCIAQLNSNLNTQIERGLLIQGDACNNDLDLDGIPNDQDDCPSDYDPTQVWRRCCGADPLLAPPCRLNT